MVNSMGNVHKKILTTSKDYVTGKNAGTCWAKKKQATQVKKKTIQHEETRSY